MQKLLARELTVEERAMQGSLRALLQRRGDRYAEPSTVREIAAKAPELFFVAALSMLESEADSAARRRLYTRLLDAPEFLGQLLRPDRFSRAQLLDVCRYFLEIDKLLDVRLAHLTPGSSEEAYELDNEASVRVLDVLDEISPGPRLILSLSHLTRHPDPRIAAKSTLVMGRRVRNNEWVKRQLGSPDPRVRASVLEACWGIDTPAARQGMRACLEDDNNRVVGNALVGLHLLGESVDDQVKHMLTDPQAPFRATAAWVMGRIGDPGFLEVLERALSDPEQAVRLAASHALQAISRPEAARAATLSSEAPAAAPAQETPEPPAEPPASKPAEEEEQGDPGWSIRLDGSFPVVR